MTNSDNVPTVQRPTDADSTDANFSIRLALRQLRTHRLSDHFLDEIMRAAKAADATSLINQGGRPNTQRNTNALLMHLRELLRTTNDENRVDLSLQQIHGVANWNSTDRYPSLRVYAAEAAAQGSFISARSGPDALGLFERMIRSTRDGSKASQLAPRIAHRDWDNTYWWYDQVSPPVLGALLQLCESRQIDFRFTARQVLIGLNQRSVVYFREQWRLVLCSPSARSVVDRIVRNTGTPYFCLPLPVAPAGRLRGFSPDVIAARDRNATFRDFLLCLPIQHPGTVSLVDQLAPRDDVLLVDPEFRNLTGTMQQAASDAHPPDPLC